MFYINKFKRWMKEQDEKAVRDAIATKAHRQELRQIIDKAYNEEPLPMMILSLLPLPTIITAPRVYFVLVPRSIKNILIGALDKDS